MLFSMIRFYNTLAEGKQAFKPVVQGKVGLYSCGPTVYNYAHIGNFMAYLFTDFLKRFLKYRGFAVKHVMNITDVDDKTIRDSQKQGKSLKEFTRFFEAEFFKDVDALGIEHADVYPRATEHVNEMVALVKTLLDNRLAYKGEDGSVYFSIKKFKEYGRLSGVSLKGLEDGASGRVKKDEYAKESASDFCLWKAWDAGDGDVFWNTELGKGRPGWHIECSAMSTKYLGKHFDIHSGGVDLVFPHHENEIAQSRGAGMAFANYWLHNNHLMVDGKKMSKSLGNFYTFRDVVAKGHSPKAFRFLILSTHYRSQLNFTFEALDAAGNTVKKINEFALRLEEVKQEKDDGSLKKLLTKARKEFTASLDDDLDVATALAIFFEFTTNANKALDNKNVSSKTAKEVLLFLKDFDYLFCVLEEKTAIPQEITRMVEERELARKAKDFKKSDELRNEITRLGYAVQDTSDGPVVRKA